MKVFKILLSIVIIFAFSLSVNAQKVKVKKKMAYVDKALYLDLTDCDAVSCVYKSTTGNEILFVQYENFQKKNPFPRNPKSKSPYRSTVTEYYSIINFTEIDLEFETSLSSRKALIKALYKNSVINDKGELDIEKAKRFIKRYRKDISGNRPIQIITN